MRGQRACGLKGGGKNEDILHLISGGSFSPWEEEKHLFQVRQRGRQGLRGHWPGHPSRQGLGSHWPGHPSYLKNPRIK